MSALLYFEAYALKRSGCHAVLNWLFNQFNDQTKVLFFNNAIPNQDPLNNMRSSGDLQNIQDLDFYRHSPHFRHQIKEWDASIVSCLYEDYIKIGKNPICDLGWIHPERILRIIILRDFYNWMASRLKHDLAKRKSVDLEALIWKWKMHAYHFRNTEDLVRINYNRWVKSSEYRTGMLECMEIEPWNDDISHVPNFGGGSSFSPVSYGKKAKSDMKVLERFSFLQDHEVMKMAREDRELNEMNDSIFGEDTYR